MSSQRAGKRRIIPDSDGEDESASQVSPPSKRARRRGADTDGLSPTPQADGSGHGAASQGIGGDAEDDAEDGVLVKLSQTPRAGGSERNADGHVAGSVVRVKLINFMTYDYVEFHPGPRLNMILGPNGTGKSSIAAAIAIGLGFPPKIMGRSPELKSYVKQDAEIATIEIELKAAKGRRNPVIWRRFGRDSEKSTFKLNGEPVGKQEIAKLVAGLGVQANNLCSFLPQDKVSDFAKMNPVTVLKETMRAAGDPRLSQWHEELVECGGEVKDIETSLSAEMRKRDALQRQVDALEPEMRQFEARRELEKEVEIAKCVVLAASWYAALDKLKEARADAQTYSKAREAESRRIQPLLDLQSHQSNILQKAQQQVKRQSRALAEHSQIMDSAQKAADRAERECKGAQADLRAIRERVKKRQQAIRRCEDDIKAQKEVLERPQADQEDVQDRLESKSKAATRLTQNLRSGEAKREASVMKQHDLRKEAQNINIDIDKRNKRHQELSNIELRRRHEAFKLDPSIQFAVEWIEAHELEFEAKVHYPPMISLNVADKQRAWQVEMCTSLNQRKTFIVQNQSDYRKLLALNGQPMPEANGRKCALHLSLVEVTQESVNPPRPCTPEQMAELGFDGYAIDFVEAEPPVIAFLCQNANLHRSALTLKPSNMINGDRVAHAGIPTWVTRNDMNRASRSTYGRRDFQFTSTAPQAARAFTLSGTYKVDTEAIKAITDEIANLKRRRQELEQPLQTAKKELETIEAQVSEIKAELHSVKSEINDLQRKANAQQEAHYRLQSLEKKLQGYMQDNSPEEQRGQLKEKILKYTKERVAALEKFQAACTASLPDVDALSKHAFAVSQLTANCKDIDQAVTTKEERMKDLEDALQEAKKRTAVAKEAKASTLAALQTAMRESEYDINVTESGKRPVDEAKVALADLQAQLEMSMQADPTAVGRHQRLKAELDERIINVENMEAKLHETTAVVDGVLSRFNPALDELVAETSEKFSAAFQRIGCTGEVRVKRVEGNYAEWGIEILVSYRDNEQMEVLTASRQSGGERSLATVTYLMSLAKMSRTPFSLVDEINQGMDQRAERSVHNQMVDVTCNNAAGQYFLITPKLLTGLDYHPNMKILTVNNGTWLPDATDETKQWGRIGACLARYRAAHAIRA